MPVSRACWSVAFALGCLAAATSLAQEASPPAPVRMPPVLERLQLSPQQRNDVEAIIARHDANFAKAWQEFTACYQQTLKAEAFLLTAIEDGFTDAQRRAAQEQRRKQTVASLTRDAAPATAAKESTKAATPSGSVPTPPGVALTPEQVTAVGKLQEKYHIHLGPMTRDIQACHGRLLALEMEKFIEIEKVLTQEQLKMLTEMLQSGEAARISGLKSDEATKK